MSELAREVWGAMKSVVMDTRGDWRRSIAEEVGMPFSRVRVLRRLTDGPLTLKAIAFAAAIDAPAATVAVNDLERRGLVSRTTDPANRRVKVVALTESGREVLARVGAVSDPVPAGIAALPESDLMELRRILARGQGAG